MMAASTSFDMDKTFTTREELGRCIKEMRISKGISVRGMAELCEMSPATVQNIEKGAFSPRLDIVQKILEQLDARMTITMKEGD